MYENEIGLVKTYLVEEYVGYEDKKEIVDSMDFSNIDDFFVDVTNQLNLLYDPHVRIIDKMNKRKVTILCKNDEDTLYVDKSIHPEISKGDEIIALGNFSISEVIKQEPQLLFDPNPERYEWQNILRKYQTVTLKNGERKNIFLDTQQELFDTEYKIEERSDYCFIRFTDFKNVGAIHEVIKNNSDLLKKSNKFIIDVRDNRGGSDFAYFPLLEYIFPPQFKLQIDYGQTFNYSKRYCDYMIDKVNKDLMKMEEGETKEAFIEYRDRMVDNYAKDKVKFTDDIEPINLGGTADNIKVIVIANERCGSSGDNFVSTVQKSEFVTVIGRATKGMNDYANCGFLELNDEFDLLCPYSKYNGIDYGHTMALVGIKPDVEVPWTIEELKNDKLMDIALEYLEK